MENSRKLIFAAGSINADIVVRSERMPRPGETLSGEFCTIVSGGKGANQAVAAFRAGGDVVFSAKTGDDMFGVFVRSEIEGAGLSGKYLITEEGLSTGTAVITVDSSGENSIIITGGANAAWNLKDLNRFTGIWEKAGYLMVNFEIPLPFLTELINTAKKHNIRTIVDGGAIGNCPDELFARFDCFSPNETEAENVTGIKITGPDSAKEAGLALLNKGCRSVLLKLGAEGSYLFDGTDEQLFPAYSVPVADTTAAGDAFTGAYTAARAEGMDQANACRFANAAGALAVEKAGALPSIPYKEDILKLMAE